LITPPASGDALTSTWHFAAVAGATPATEIRCHVAEAVAVVSDQVTLTSEPPEVSHLMPIRSATVAPEASAKTWYSWPAMIVYEAAVRACISPDAVLASRKVPSPFRPPVPLLIVQFSLAVHPDVLGSTDSVTVDK
jgi:hypothetical protein